MFQRALAAFTTASKTQKLRCAYEGRGKPGASLRAFRP